MRLILPTAYAFMQDEEYIGGLAQGCMQYYWTAEDDWLLEWSDALIHSGSANKIWSISWASYDLMRRAQHTPYSRHYRLRCFFAD